MPARSRAVSTLNSKQTQPDRHGATLAYSPGRRRVRARELLNQYGPSGGGSGQYQLIIAGLVISTIPMIVVFFIGQRYFVEGIVTQGGKG